MAIPRNLVYVFLVVIIASFGGMFYIVQFKSKDFQYLYDPVMAREEVVVHPFFVHLREFMKKQKYLPTLQVKDISEKNFYDYYVSKSQPVVLLKYAENWPALQKWADKSYLRQQWGNNTVNIIKLQRNEKGAFLKHNQVSERRDTFAQFLNRTENLTYNGVFMYYVQNAMITSHKMMGDYVRPSFSKFMRIRNQGFTMWKPFQRKPSFSKQERIFCVITGKEEFAVVSPADKQHIYSGVFDDLPPYESPVNFFGTDYGRYPLLKEARIHKHGLEPGDCFYVPAFYWL